MSLDAALLQTLLTEAIGAGDYADAFFERKVTRSFRLQEGHIHEAGVSVTMGVGIRVLCGEQAGYAYSDDLSIEALRKTAHVASLIARNGGSARVTPVAIGPHPQAANSIYELKEQGQLRAESATYVDLLSRADIAARYFDPRVESVNAFISDEMQDVVIATSEGKYVSDRRPLVTLGVQCVARGAVRGNGYVGDGGRTSLDYYLKRTPENLAREAARIACINVEAVEAPAGEMPIVVGSGGGGVLLHEAVGHGLEGDFNRQGTSLYSGRIGERVASELVTIYDDGNLEGERGSLAIDDEGTPGQHKVLVERGVLQGYMQDHLNASLMGMTSTGSGRRQSFRVAPQPRMCNTYMPAGESTVDEIIGSVQRGIYAKSFAGGQVDITKGDFVFMVAEGYLIEDGKITAPIRGATLVGNGPDIMTRVVAVGNDPHLANRHYTCGKGGQYVPVGVGMPTVKIASVTVGGSAVG
ncbi:MAG TPA: metallopeptidase TldD-related protein [Candidatus Baltobacteraceae bacterium]